MCLLSDPGIAFRWIGVIHGEGGATIDESALAWASVPVNGMPATRCRPSITQNRISEQSVRVGRITTFLSQIIRMVSDAAATKAPIAQDCRWEVSGVFIAGGHHHSYLVTDL